MDDAAENTDMYFTIHHWMITELGLKGTSLMVYALLYSYTQTVGEFSGSLSYLAERVNATVQQVHKQLKDMVERGLLEKEDVFKNGVKYVRYHTNNLHTPIQKSLMGGMQKSLIPCKKVEGGIQKNCMGVYKKVEGGIQKSLNNNKDYNKINNKDYNKVCVAEPQDTPHTPTQEGTEISFQGTPSLEQVRAYCREIQSTVDPQTFYDHYSSTGWKANNAPIADWQAKLRYWDAKDRQEGKTTAAVNTPGYAEREEMLKIIFPDYEGAEIWQRNLIMHRKNGIF